MGVYFLLCYSLLPRMRTPLGTRGARNLITDYVGKPYGIDIEKLTRSLFRTVTCWKAGNRDKYSIRWSCPVS